MVKIDFVVPLVFPDDKEWQESYLNSKACICNAVDNVRFRSWGTEELLIKCVEKFMPWVNTIHILLAQESQYKDWMKPYHIVYHRDFIPQHLLPCFNVCTFEMFLHNIPNLSEHFIYSNDDFFPIAPLSETDFFRDGLPCQHCQELAYPFFPNIFHKLVMHGLNMISADFGKHFSKHWMHCGHSMQPMLKRTVEVVCAKHCKEINKSFTPNRSKRNLNQYIFPFYQHFSGQYVDYVPKRKYLGQAQSLQEIADAIRSTDACIVCVNDHENIYDWEERARVVREEIAKKLAY